MKTLNVVGAIFIKDGKLFYAKRGEAKNPEVAYKYEFIGGKVEEGESEEDALLRELREEADLPAKVLSHFTTVTYDYSMYRVNLSVYLCEMLGRYSLKEHIESGWISLEDIRPSLWAPADEEILKKLVDAALK